MPVMGTRVHTYNRVSRKHGAHTHTCRCGLIHMHTHRTHRHARGAHLRVRTGHGVHTHAHTCTHRVPRPAQSCLRSRPHHRPECKESCCVCLQSKPGSRSLGALGSATEGSTWTFEDAAEQSRVFTVRPASTRAWAARPSWACPNPRGGARLSGAAWPLCEWAPPGFCRRVSP